MFAGFSNFCLALGGGAAAVPAYGAIIWVTAGLNSQWSGPIFIDHSGTTVVPPLAVSSYTKPPLTMKMDDDASLYVGKGEWSTSAQFIRLNDRNYLPFSEDLAASNSGKTPQWGFVDHDFNQVIPETFDDVRPFHEGLAAACVQIRADGTPSTNNDAHRRWGHIDRIENWVKKPQFNAAASFSDGLAMVVVQNPHTTGSTETKNGYIDKTGNFIIPPTFHFSESFSEGLAAAASETR